MRKPIASALGIASSMLALCAAPALLAQEPVPYEIPRVEDDISISVDGVLDEPAWRRAVVIDLPFETQPGNNIPARVGTNCQLMHDSTHLYVGCRAFDPEPQRIRANLADRDRPWEDDWVGVYLDTFNDQRRAFQFLVNPLGVQMDGVRDEVNRREDESWDGIWKSAGRITDRGYVVEFAIPFAQLRFAGGQLGQTWGIGLFRFYPRDRTYFLESQPIDRDVDCQLCQVLKIHGFAGIKRGRNLELDPTLTAIRTDERDEIWDPLETTAEDVELGITATWGFRPNLALSATINPDFSQVEADVAQLRINRRFSLFFPEKRPFFVEGADYFESPFNAVYTRTVIEPAWGIKVTGKEGRNAFGVYAVDDDVTGLLFPGPEESDRETFDWGNRAAVFRYRRDVGNGSTLGALFTGRKGEEYSNLVYGIDGTLRATRSDTFRFQALASRTEYPEKVQKEFDQPSGLLDDSALTINYEHGTEHWFWGVIYDDLGFDFRADSGFVPQVGTRSVYASLWRSWWGDDEDWYSRTMLGGNYQYTEDKNGDLLQREFQVGARYLGSMRSFVLVQVETGDEVADGEYFADQQSVQFQSRIWPSGNIELKLNGRLGDTIDYDNIQPGREVRLEPGLFWRPGIHWEIHLDHEFGRLEVDAGRLFTANLTQMRLVYHLNLRTFVRAIVQYTDIDRDPTLYLDEVEARENELVTQFLFSYQLNARTVVFLGYSDSTESNDTFDDVLMDRTVFVKLGYAWLL